MVKKKVILGVLAVILVLLLAGCYLFKPPVGLYVTLAKPHGTPTSMQFSWSATCTAKDASLAYTLYIKPESAATITVNTTDTEFATALEEGKYTAFVMAKASQHGKIIKTASSDEEPFSVSPADAVFTNTTTAYATDTVTVSWKPVDGLAHMYEYDLDNGVMKGTTTATSVTLSEIGQGKHELTVKIKGSVNSPGVFDFLVDNGSGPYMYIYALGREYGGNFDIDKNVSAPEGRYGLILWRALSYGTDLDDLLVRFYRYDSTTGQRERVNLTDSDGDGVYDSWTIPATPGAHEWYSWDLSDTYGYYNYFIVNNDRVDFPFKGGLKPGKGLFEIGTKYGMYFAPYKDGKRGAAYVTFKLDERYSDDEEPVVKLISDKATVTAGGTFTVTVKAPNVKEYVASCEHSAGNDVSFNSSLMYIQIPVVYNNLEVKKVEMLNFMPDKKDLSDVATSGGVVTIYRGFVNGTDESDPVTDVLAKITFQATDVATNTTVQIGYEGMFAYYPDYPDIPNSIFRDSNDSPIDGIITDLTPQIVPAVKSGGGE